MRKIVLLAHTSLDGNVANPNHNLEWFEPSDESLALVCELTQNADAALFGRISYKLLDEYWPTAHQKPHTKKLVLLIFFSLFTQSITEIFFGVIK